MPTPRVAYPISKLVENAVRDYPEIGKKLSIAGRLESELEIVRVLGNLHYDHLKTLARLINDMLPASGSIGSRVLAQTSPFQFSQALAELFLFARMYGPFSDRVSAVELLPDEKGPDLMVACPGFTAMFEVFTPIELCSYQLFEEYVLNVLKYARVSFGYDLEVELGDDSNDSYYAYRFSANTEAWLQEFAKCATDQLSVASEGSTFSLPGPATGLNITIRVVSRFDDQACRSIRFHAPTKSSDSRLFSEVGTAADTAKTEWGRKLESKLRKMQCGSRNDNIIRILVVNFALADTGWPEFIGWPSFEERFTATLNLLVGTSDPYDVVVPARLGTESHFGGAVVLNATIEPQWRAFAEEAQIARPQRRTDSSDS